MFICNALYISQPHLPIRRFSQSRRHNNVRTCAQLEALVLDCDGVIVESEDLHRIAYNRCFEHFKVSTDGGNSIVEWDVEFYDEFQNKVGGGKPKMRWYFNKHGWPSSTAKSTPPETDVEREELVDILQAWKTDTYQSLIGSGEVKPRPGVLRLLQEAKDKSFQNKLIQKTLFLQGIESGRL